MANYTCPVCGKTCGNLNILNVCVNQHMQDEKKEKEEKTKKIVGLKQNAIKKKIEELKVLIKEFNELPDNPYTVTYLPPQFVLKRNESIKKDDNTNKNKINKDIKTNLGKMLDEVNKKIQDSKEKEKDITEEEERQIARDLDACLDTLFGWGTLFS